MCRFLAYMGPSLTLAEMLYEPEHSLIHQSVHAHEREEPLNGDGWGVGWYDPRAGRRPGLYRTLQPAWSDDNMRHIAPMIETPAFLAHVRAASPGLPVHQLNCHPFQGGEHTHEDPEDLAPVERGRQRLLFMHNGSIGGFGKIKRPLQERLSDEAFASIRGSTDSEHAFALLQDALGKAAEDPTADQLADAVRETVETIQAVQQEAGVGGETTHLNVAVSDGERLVALRYANQAGGQAPSLYAGQAGGFFCEETGRLQARDPEGDGAVLVASERLWQDERVWTRIPPSHLAIVDAEGALALEPV